MFSPRWALCASPGILTNSSLMFDTRTTRKSSRPPEPFGSGQPVPAVLVAHAPIGSTTVDRCSFLESLVVGRSSDCDFQIPQQAVTAVFSERFGDGPVAMRYQQVEQPARSSHYEKNRALIIETYLESGENLSETERRLREQGITCARRHLSEYLKRWEVRSG